MCRLPVVLGSLWIIDGQMELWLSVWLQCCAGKKFPVHKEQKMPLSLLTQEYYDPLSRSHCSFKPAFMRRTQPAMMISKLFTRYGLDSAVSKLQFPQECLEFPPLCNTRSAGSRFDGWISSFTRGSIPTHMLSLWTTQATSLNPRQMNCPSSFSGPLNPLRFTFKGCMFWFKLHSSKLTSSLPLLVCHFAEYGILPTGINPFFSVIKLSMLQRSLFCKWDSRFLVY